MLRYTFKGHNIKAKHLLVYEIESVIWKRFISLTWPHKCKRDLLSFFTAYLLRMYLMQHATTVIKDCFYAKIILVLIFFITMM